MELEDREQADKVLSKLNLGKKVLGLIRKAGWKAPYDEIEGWWIVETSQAGHELRTAKLQEVLDGKARHVDLATLKKSLQTITDLTPKSGIETG